MNKPAEGFPAVCGLNATVIVALWPGANNRGREGPATTKERSDEVTDEILIGTDDRLVITSVSCLDWPTTADPKFRLLVATTSEPPREDDPDAESAWHPAIAVMAINTIKAAARRSQRELRPMCEPFQAALAFARRENLEFAFVADGWRGPHQIQQRSHLATKNQNAIDIGSSTSAPADGQVSNARKK